MLALWFSNPRYNLRINADNSQKIHGETTLEPCEEPQPFLKPSITKHTRQSQGKCTSKG